jgi:hypothetical protein
MRSTVVRVARVVVPAGLLLLALTSGPALAGIIQLAVQLGVPLGLLGYVAWRRVRALRARRATHLASDRSLPQLALAQVRGFVARGIAAFGGGFYGLVAAGMFVVHQVRTLPYRVWLDPANWRLPALSWPNDWFALLTETIGPVLWDVLLDVGTEWVDGFVYAMTWPVHLMRVIGPLGIALVLGLGAAVFHLARKIPAVDAFQREVDAADPDSFWSPFPDDVTPDAPSEAHPPGDDLNRERPDEHDSGPNGPGSAPPPRER